MALSKVMTMVNDSGTGGSKIKPITPKGPSNAKLQQVATNVANMNKSSGSGSTNTATTQQASYSGGGGGGGGVDYSSILAQIRNAANEAYNKAKAGLDSAKSTTLAGLLDSYNARKAALKGDYDNSKQTLDDDNALRLREAYINKMLNARDLGQLLLAQGLTGGQSETTAANMLNNYANNRNALNRTHSTNLRDLLTKYNSSNAEAQAAYNDQVAQTLNNYANVLSNLEMNRANMVMSAMPSYKDLLNMI